MTARLLLTLLFSLSMMPTKAQVFWTENFNSGTGWNLNVVMGTEGLDPNFFTISAAEGGGITPNLGAPSSCGVANNGNNTLHVTSVWNPSGGASYDAGGLCGLLTCPLTNRRAESPIINCSGKSNMTLSFNMIHNGQGSIDNAVVWFTTNGFATTLPVPAIPKTLTGCGGQGLWTSHSIAVPAACNNSSSVQFAIQWVNNDDGVGTDPSFAIDDIALSTSTAVNTITCSAPANALCACYSYNVPYVAVGTFNAGNTFSVELSDATGSFTTPLTIGSINSTSLTGSIPVVIPCNQSAGTGYRMRVVSTTPATTGSDNGSNMLINASTSSPQMFLSFTPGAIICQNTLVTFTVTFSSPASPMLTWKKNGTVVGSGTTTYSTTLVSGDQITCVAQFTGVCPNPVIDSVFSQFSIIPPPPTVGIQVNPGTTVCQGDAITLSGTGASSYNWFGGVVNGQSFVPASTSTYSVIGVDASSGCTNTSSVTVNVTPNSTYGITLSSNPTNVISGVSTQYTANILPSGLTAYQIHWYRNNQFFSTTAAPQNSITFTPIGIQDSVYAWLQPAGCYTPDSAKSNTIKVKLAEGLEPTQWPDGVMVYPNPVDDYLMLQGLQNNSKLKLVDFSGRVFHEVPNAQANKIPTSSIPAGNYILQLEMEGRLWYRKIAIWH